MSNPQTIFVTLDDGSCVGVQVSFDIHSGAWRAQIGEETYTVRVDTAMRDGAIGASVDGVPYWFEHTGDAGADRLTGGLVGGSTEEHALHTVDAGSVMLASQEPPGPVTSGPELRAPITGEVIDVLAQPGRTVRTGELAVRIEAMKMEISIRFESGGTIASVPVAVGDRVRAGDLLVALAVDELHLDQQRSKR